MQTIAEKQGIDRIRMFNRLGQVMFSTNGEDRRVPGPGPLGASLDFRSGPGGAPRPPGTSQPH